MITYKQGNIFTSKCQVIVNTVNCSGVMGAGIALELKWRYPEMFKVYQQQCKDKRLTIGMLSKFKDHQSRFSFEYVLNFPTKKNWKLPSTLTMLEQGLEKFVNTYDSCGFTSVAFPLLGVGKGGLETNEVKALMEGYLRDLPIHIEIWEYRPDAEDDLIERFINDVRHESSVVLAQRWKVSPKIAEKISNELSSMKYSSLIQLSNAPGIGETTMTKLYEYATAKSLVQDSLF